VRYVALPPPPPPVFGLKHIRDFEVEVPSKAQHLQLIAVSVLSTPKVEYHQQDFRKNL